MIGQIRLEMLPCIRVDGEVAGDRPLRQGGEYGPEAGGLRRDLRQEGAVVLPPLAAEMLQIHMAHDVLRLGVPPVAVKNLAKEHLPLPEHAHAVRGHQCLAQL